MSHIGARIEYDYSQAPTTVGSFHHQLSHFVDLTREMTHNTRPRIVEFGAGTGLYVKELERMGVDAYGFDIAPRSMKLLRPDKRITSIVDLKQHTYDGIYIKDVLEHCPDLGEIFGILAHLLASRGIVMTVFRVVDDIEASLINEVSSSLHMYYPINEGKIRISALENGISFTEKTHWLPHNKEEDWYFQLKKRTVLFGKK